MMEVTGRLVGAGYLLDFFEQHASATATQGDARRTYMTHQDLVNALGVSGGGEGCPVDGPTARLARPWRRECECACSTATDRSPIRLTPTHHHQPKIILTCLTRL
jgi:hypothetical protein